MVLLWETISSFDGSIAGQYCLLYLDVLYGKERGGVLLWQILAICLWPKKAYGHSHPKEKTCEWLQLLLYIQGLVFLAEAYIDNMVLIIGPVSSSSSSSLHHHPPFYIFFFSWPLLSYRLTAMGSMSALQLWAFSLCGHDSHMERGRIIIAYSGIITKETQKIPFSCHNQK